MSVTLVDVGVAAVKVLGESPVVVRAEALSTRASLKLYPSFIRR